jgi:hypothetical protein
VTAPDPGAELRRRRSGVRRERDTLRDAALVTARFVTDDGARTELDAVIAAFGLTRESLGHELDDDHRTEEQIAGRSVEEARQRSAAHWSRPTS